MALQWSIGHGLRPGSRFEGEWSAKRAVADVHNDGEQIDRRVRRMGFTLPFGGGVRVDAALEALEFGIGRLGSLQCPPSGETTHVWIRD